MKGFTSFLAEAKNKHIQQTAVETINKVMVELMVQESL